MVVGQTVYMKYRSCLYGLTEKIPSSRQGGGGESPRVALALVGTHKFSCGNSVLVFKDEPDSPIQ